MIGLTLDFRRVFLIMLLASVAFLAACKGTDRVVRINGPTMGTTFNIVAVNPPRAVEEDEVKTAVQDALADVNQRMSNWDPASEISLFNAQMGLDPVRISPALEIVMRSAHQVHVASDGRFDTTIGPLIELWGFGAEGERVVPSDAQIEAARARSGHANTLEIQEGRLRKKQPGTQVYLAALAKGYGADRVAQALEDLEITDYLVEIGGDLYASGRNPDGQPWQIGIETPSALNRAVSDVVSVSGLGLASSGDYRNYFEEDGQRFSHLIDPISGRPISHTTASATVLAENAMFADAWATAMLILGSEEGLRIAERENIAVLFIDRDRKSPDIGFETVVSSRFVSLTGKEP